MAFIASDVKVKISEDYIDNVQNKKTGGIFAKSELNPIEYHILPIKAPLISVPSLLGWKELTSLL